MPDRLKGKIALVSGSTRGIGRSIAEMFAREGAKVAVTGRTVPRGEKVVDIIRDAGGEAEFVALDVTDEQSVKHAVETTVERFGSLTTLVNNAAPTLEVANSIKRMAEFTTEEFDHIFRATLVGNVFWASRYAIPHLDAAGGGSIINISSGQSMLGMGGFSVYGAAKAAMNSLTRSIAVEEAPRHIRCNAIVVGRVVAKGDTGAGITPGHLTRLGVPNDIAYAATWLASDEAEFVTGSIVTADGGFTINGGNLVPGEEQPR
jgi:NAD(P)-dependent dehydrogenase (short-subunit alcohol dehydrogenase family)